MTAYFYDGGANIGQTFNWHLLKGSFADRHVVCFEPSPRNLSALAATCRAMRTKFASVRIVTAALGIPGVRTFYEGKTPMGDSLLSARAGIDGLAVEVAVISLAEYLRTHTKTGDQVIVKLDIEGAEGDVLMDLLHAAPLDRVEQLLVEWHGADPRQVDIEARFTALGLPLERWPH